MLKWFGRLRKNEKGQALVEYAIILALVSLFAAGSFSVVGGKVGGSFDKVGHSIGGDVDCAVIYNVKDYGAKGDGVTDDLVKIQELIDSIDTSDGCVYTIYFPKSEYMISGDIVIPSNLNIVGDGAESIIKLTGNVGDKNVLSSKNADNITVRKLTLDGNIEGQDNTLAHTTVIQFHHTDNLIIEDMVIVGGLIEGIYVYDSDNFYINNIVAYNNGYYREDASGVHIDGSRNGVVSNVETYNNGFHGLIVGGTTHSQFRNIETYDNGYDGVKAQWSTNNNTFSNISSKNNTRGIYLTHESNNNLIINSDFSYNKGNGINLYKETKGNHFVNVVSSNNRGGGIIIYEDNTVYYDNLSLNNNEEGDVLYGEKGEDTGIEFVYKKYIQ